MIKELEMKEGEEIADIYEYQLSMIRGLLAIFQEYEGEDFRIKPKTIEMLYKHSIDIHNKSYKNGYNQAIEDEAKPLQNLLERLQKSIPETNPSEQPKISVEYYKSDGISSETVLPFPS